MAEKFPPCLRDLILCLSGRNVNSVEDVEIAGAYVIGNAEFCERRVNGHVCTIVRDTDGYNQWHGGPCIKNKKPAPESVPEQPAAPTKPDSQAVLAKFMGRLLGSPCK